MVTGFVADYASELEIIKTKHTHNRQIWLVCAHKADVSDLRVVWFIRAFQSPEVCKSPEETGHNASGRFRAYPGVSACYSVIHREDFNGRDGQL